MSDVIETRRLKAPCEACGTRQYRNNLVFGLCIKQDDDNFDGIKSECVEIVIKRLQARAEAAEKARDELLTTFKSLQMNPVGFGDAVARVEKVNLERDL